MKRAVGRIVGIGVMAAVAIAVAGPAAADKATQAQAVLDRVIAEHGLAGISAAVGNDGEVVWSGGAGFADIENEVPATGGMVHRIASISKPMAAVAALRLVEEGVLDLDTPIQEYYREYPEKPWPVTIRHLLNHTSGTRHYNPGESGTMTHYARQRLAARVFQDDDLLFEPGTSYQYTTYGYTLLGCVLESVTRKSFKEIMTEQVWGPAGMHSTYLEEPQEIVPKRARGYSPGPEGSIRNARYDDLSIKYPGGGMIASAEDLVRFAMAFNDGQLVSPETIEAMLTPAELSNGEKRNYGLGWGVDIDETHGPFFMHSGGQLGTSTRLFMYRESGVAIAVISNLNGGAGVGEAVMGLEGVFME